MGSSGPLITCDHVEYVETEEDLKKEEEAIERVACLRSIVDVRLTTCELALVGVYKINNSKREAKNSKCEYNFKTTKFVPKFRHLPILNQKVLRTGRRTMRKSVFSKRAGLSLSSSSSVR